MIWCVRQRRTIEEVMVEVSRSFLGMESAKERRAFREMERKKEKEGEEDILAESFAGKSRYLGGEERREGNHGR